MLDGTEVKANIRIPSGSKAVWIEHMCYNILSIARLNSRLWDKNTL